MNNKENLFTSNAFQGTYSKILPAEGDMPPRVVLGITGSYPKRTGRGFMMTCRFSNPSHLRDLIDSLRLKLMWLENIQKKAKERAI